MTFALDTNDNNVVNIKVIGVGGGGGNAVNRMVECLSLIHICYGGTALLMRLAEMGILLNISRHSVIEKP